MDPVIHLIQRGTLYQGTAVLGTIYSMFRHILELIAILHPKMQIPGHDTMPPK